MKKKIAFVTDSTAYLPDKLKNHPDVYVVPIVIISNEQAYEDGVDLSSEKLYEMIRTEEEVPKTSQPSVGRFTALYEELKKDYDAAIAIHVSSKLSGTISSSASGKDQADFPVEVIDSKSLSYAITTLLMKGLSLVEQGIDYKEVANQLRESAKHSRNLVLLGSLEQLHKGGRMSGAQFLIGNLLKIKPILSIQANGELELVERVRSEEKALKKVIQLIKDSCEKNTVHQLGIMHGNALEKANMMEQRLKEVIPNVQTVIGEISSSLAVHAGEDTLGIFWSVE